MPRKRQGPLPMADLTPAKQMKAMIERCTTDCEQATQAELIAWADTDSILALFAQKELVYRDMMARMDVLEATRTTPNG